MPDSTSVAERYFTLAEANAALAEVRPLAERMVERKRALAAAERRRAEVLADIQGNGGGIPPTELAERAEEVEREAQALGTYVERIHALGAVVKDLDVGLVDFPSLRGDDEVLLCWRVGEDEIAYWHGTDEGFAARKPV